MGAGADPDSAAVVQTAQEKGVSGLGWASAMTKFGEKAPLAASINKWGVYYTKVIGDVLENKWKPETVWWGLKEGMIDLGAYNAVVPEDVKALVETRKKGMTCVDSVGRGLRLYE